MTIAKDTGHATVLCALCNLKDEFPAHPAAQPIDVYSYFTDRFYGVKDPRAIIPREREITQAPPDEAMAEETTAPEPLQEAEKVLQPPVSDEQPKAEEPMMAEESSHPETLETVKDDNLEGKSPAVDESQVGSPEEPSVEAGKESDEDAEPFADILENKDKKRYSSSPLPQQSTEQSS